MRPCRFIIENIYENVYPRRRLYPPRTAFVIITIVTIIVTIPTIESE